MKPIRLIFLLFFLLLIKPAFADEGSLMSGDAMNYVGYGAIMIAMITLIMAMLVVLRAFKVVAKILLGPDALKEAKPDKIIIKAERKAERAERFQKLLSLKPMSEEKSLLIEHDYDGIQELNNPIPAWFMYLFYATICFAVCYLLVYHVFGIGQLQYDEYKTEMAVAATEKTAYLASAANRVDENTVKLTTAPSVLQSGQAIFKQSCVPCHGEHAQGVVGPNLTDDYWLHGNKISDLFKTIKYGVQSKGMPTWEKQLTPKQISDVANYVESLHGTNPPNPKEPQGDKMVYVKAGDQDKIAQPKK